MLIRVLFGVLALTALGILFSAPPAEFDAAERLQRALVLGGMAVASAGLAVPWGRWLTLVSPGRSLGFASRVLGWCGGSGLPAALAFGSAPAALACASVCVASIALWQGRLWAAWAWYAIVLAAIAGAGARLVWILGGLATESESPYSAGQKLGAVFGAVLWIGVGLVLWREITAWRRARSANPAPAEPSTR